MAAPILLVSGFGPFGGEGINPSWEVARRLHSKTFGGLRIEAIRLPVDCGRAARRMTSAIESLSPRAVLGLGQAGGRPALSIERVAINLAAGRAGNEAGSADAAKPVVRGGPDAYFARLPFAAILRALGRHKIPAALSLSAGAYACNAAMYAALHALRDRSATRAGFIHLPYDPRQAARHRGAPSMSLDLMEQAVAAALEAIAKSR